ncbi:hypothetical protein ACVJBD_001826 [Rhizobium mongolense]
MKLFYIAFAGVLYLASFAGDVFAQANHTLTIQLKDGPVVVQLMPDVAPQTRCADRGAGEEGGL